MALRTIVAIALLFVVVAGRKSCRRQTPLVCNFRPTAGNTARGRVVFTPKMVNGKCRVRVRARFSGLTRNTLQGWHIHESGDISSPDGSATGGHFTSPNGDSRFAKHGFRKNTFRHWGDLGNLHVRSNGRARVSFNDPVIHLGGILGRGMIIHASKDNGPSAQPSGDSGARVAQCRIVKLRPRPCRRGKRC